MIIHSQLSNSVFDVYFYFTTNSTLFDIRNVVMTIRGGEEINNVEFNAFPSKFFIADDYYSLKTQLLPPYFEMPIDWYYLRLSKDDFPLHVAVSLMIDNPVNPKKSIAGYGTPVILSIPPPTLDGSDQIHFVIQYDKGSNEFTIIQKAWIDPEAIVENKSRDNPKCIIPIPCSSPKIPSNLSL